MEEVLELLIGTLELGYQVERALRKEVNAWRDKVDGYISEITVKQHELRKSRDECEELKAELKKEIPALNTWAGEVERSIEVLQSRK
ncbi:hypothetical protein L211DRAFT_139145 [Terfezia boudieri ATCC MYA-4762]|uniref:Uncharacterized protein n=1 Tax=Terfezia boudieri ATCC MYA-4762 TaxID=1051890 RepID=A0A3N4LWU7_9PEZI|nr:hypothetical protein L211DRAFT_419920 [Terfezia boudieri ATCC MYA-4762]RPB25131.1 hypothetical protein L211DRAFT_139145 [Terfezia boudieri ATCC MYA-4762]